MCCPISWRTHLPVPRCGGPTEGSEAAYGGAGVLNTDDDIYQQIRSTLSGTTSWNGTFSGVPNTLRKLEVTYKGSNSRACTQRVRIWNWRTAT